MICASDSGYEGKQVTPQKIFIEPRASVEELISCADKVLKNFRLQLGSLIEILVSADPEFMKENQKLLLPGLGGSTEEFLDDSLLPVIAEEIPYRRE